MKFKLKLVYGNRYDTKEVELPLWIVNSPCYSTNWANARAKAMAIFESLSYDPELIKISLSLGNVTTEYLDRGKVGMWVVNPTAIGH